MLVILLFVIGLAVVSDKGKIMSSGLQAVIGFTLAALVLYFFVGKADESSKFIGALSAGYTSTVRTLQGRG